MKLSELIYVETKSAWTKISASLKNTNRNTKPRWEIRLEIRIKNLQAKIMRQKKETGICKGEKRKTTQQI